MTRISINVIVVDEVASDASLEREISNKVITSYYNCGGIYFYQIVEHIHDTRFATDTMIYCCQCGQSQGGMFNDPGDELDEQMVAKKKINWWEYLDWNEFDLKLIKSIPHDEAREYALAYRSKVQKEE